LLNGNILLLLRRSLFCLLLVNVTSALAGSPYAGLRPGGTSKVIEIVDGDTVRLVDGREVRLVGMQAPKLPLGRKNFKKWPLADEAKSELSDLTFRKTVHFGFGGQSKDRHGRILAHLFLDNAGKPGLWVQGQMLEIGMARTYTFYDNRSLVRELYEKERLARDRSRGIWRLNYYKVRDATAVARDIGSFQLVEGRPVRVAKSGQKVFVNYSEDWKQDFTVLIQPKARRMFEELGISYRDFAGQNIRVRGWVRSWNGPLIEITHPEQIQLLD